MKHATSISELEIFVKVAETGSLSKAAESLGVTPSAVSRSVAKLEATLGIQLFRRTTRHVTLTDAGTLFFGRTRAILDDLGSAVDDMHAFRTVPQGMLRIACSVAFGCTQLMRLIGRYRSQYPTVDVHISLTDRRVNLAEGEFDIAIQITGHLDPACVARKIAPVRWVYCASPAYLEQHGTPAGLSDMQHHSCLVYPEITDHGHWSHQVGEETRMVPVRGTIQANSSLPLLFAALYGYGIACLPTYIATPYLAEGSLVSIFDDFPIQRDAYALYAMYFPNRYANPMIRTFIDFLLEHAPELD